MLHAQWTTQTAAGRVALQRAVLALLVAVAGPGPPHSRAADGDVATRPVPTTAPTSQSLDGDVQRLTVEEVQIRMRLTQTSPTLSEAQKAEAVSLYSQAIQQLQLADRFRAVATRHEAEHTQAPEQLSAAQAELEHPNALNLPAVPDDAPLSQLDDARAQVETELEHARLAQSELISLQDRWLRRRLELPSQMTTAKQRLSELVATSAAPARGPQGVAVEFAQRTLQQAERITVEAQIQRFQEELLNYAAQHELIDVRLEAARRHVTALEETAADWRGRVQQRRRDDIARELQEMEQAVETASTALHKWADESLRFAQERNELNRKSERADERLRLLAEQLASQRANYEKIEKHVQAAGGTGSTGEVQPSAGVALPNTGGHSRSERQYTGEMGQVRQRMGELQDRRSKLTDKVRIADAVRTRLDGQMSPDDAAQAETEARTWMKRQQGQVATLLSEYGAYFDKLVELDSREREFVDVAQQMARYREANVVWLQNSPRPSLADVAYAGEAARWFVSPEGALALAAAVRDTAACQPMLILSGLVGVSVLLVMQRRLHSILVSSGEHVGRPGKDSMRTTGKALAGTILLAGTWPAVLALGGWTVGRAGDVAELAHAASAGFLAASGVLLATALAAQLVQVDGLAEKHFRWRAATLQLLRHHLRWLTLIVVPCVFVFAALEAQSVATRKDSLGRAAFVAAALVVAVFTHRLLRPARDSGANSRSERGGWGQFLRQLAHLSAVAAPLALAVAALLGYYSGAIYLSWRFLLSVWLGLGLLIVYSLLRRWLLMRVRLRALRDTRERAAQAAERREAGEPEPGVVLNEEPGIDLADIRIHTSRLARTGIVVAAAVGFWMIWADVLPALQVFRSIPVWTNRVEVTETVVQADGTTASSKIAKAVPVTLGDVGLALALVVLTAIAMRNIPGLLEVAVLERLPLAASGRYAVSTISGYVIAVVGIVLAFNVIGIGWSKVQWLVAAMTVGLGFGLQEIFANFVSGLIILFERPIRVGDAVTVGEASGLVTRIQMRATTITDWDHKELIVPNKRFITGEVLNWTLSDSVNRLTLPISVAHGSNPTLVRDTLVRIAEAAQGVAKDPPPSAYFRGLGPSSMDFELAVFVRREEYGRVLHDLNSAVEEALVANGLSIATPIQMQQIQVRASGDGAVAS